MPTSASSSYTAFAGDRRVARGSYAEIALALAAQAPHGGPVLVFDDATGAPVDAPHAPEQAARLAAMRAAQPSNATAGRSAAPDAALPRPGAGRPRLGVVAREVTLLPRHWDWLASQRGGASAALRRLVDQARRQSESADQRRAAGERSYKFMSAIAGHLPGFEEAARALFAADGPAFGRCIANWPRDVRAHLHELTEGALDTPPEPPAATPRRASSATSPKKSPQLAKAPQPSPTRKGASA
ncbi:DUF2239 family protein [Ottowia sp. GY511]|uniref:DUF2239 family protein n=1 Tax=Ottowia flava TaxID=2675430 RepID=A0ABW4KRH5_9BURK|nr:DUF2239 family protein [Ottowia sp. GY511]TXK24710.1 DUF2239 family protein [Ottowia sp. GY511]